MAQEKQINHFSSKAKAEILINPETNIPFTIHEIWATERKAVQKESIPDSGYEPPEDYYK